MSSAISLDGSWASRLVWQGQRVTDVFGLHRSARPGRTSNLETPRNNEFPARIPRSRPFPSGWCPARDSNLRTTTWRRGPWSPREFGTGLRHRGARRWPRYSATRFRHARDTKCRVAMATLTKQSSVRDLGRCIISDKHEKRREPAGHLLIRRFRVRFPGDPRS
jgi:hypothetical protein